VKGDLQRAGDALTGPFDLIYSMTAIYAVPDQPAAFAQLGALAAPGAGLRLLEYSDPHGRFAGATSGSGSWGWWRPLRPRELPEVLATAGWTDVAVRDLQPEFVRWYRELCERIAARRHAITHEFGREWYEFALREYAGILELVNAGVLGGVLVRATARG
jgi:cyclopropane fatty-acyl-phospholipid synthase-like methyltransferase